MKETLVLRTVIDDGTANLQCTLFDKEALEMLELSELTVGAQAAVDIKRDYLLGKETLMLLRFRNNQYGELEAVCRQVVSHHPDAKEEIAFVESKLKKLKA